MLTSDLEFCITDATSIQKKKIVFLHPTPLPVSFWASKFEIFKRSNKTHKNLPKLAVKGVFFQVLRDSWQVDSLLLQGDSEGISGKVVKIRKQRRRINIF
jgi:hypothetical protein